MDHANQFLGTERIGTLMRRYAIPCIISLLVGALYNIVDQIFMANASYLGSYCNAANTVAFPLTEESHKESDFRECKFFMTFLIMELTFRDSCL